VIALTIGTLRLADMDCRDGEPKESDICKQNELQDVGLGEGVGSKEQSQQFE
jgi:hypothetical protein